MSESAGKSYTTEQFAAAGRVALSFRHDLNNPLSALLAEAQLLALEPMAAEQLAAVERIIDLCRRTIALTRSLDAAVRASVES